jgi:hypothetical protein
MQSRIRSLKHGVLLGLSAVALTLVSVVHADELDALQASPEPLPALFADSYLLGITEHAADDYTTITGWRLSESVYFGSQDGEDSGLSLVWQHDHDQMSISSDGIRFTRRF